MYMSFATAYSQLDDAHLAEDVAQERLFLEAYIHLDKLRRQKHFQAGFGQLLCVR